MSKRDELVRVASWVGMINVFRSEEPILPEVSKGRKPLDEIIEASKKPGRRLHELEQIQAAIRRSDRETLSLLRISQIASGSSIEINRDFEQAVRVSRLRAGLADSAELAELIAIAEDPAHIRFFRKKLSAVYNPNDGVSLAISDVRAMFDAEIGIASGLAS